LGLAVLRVARRLFTGTPVERLRVTSWLRARVYWSAFGRGELKTSIRGVTLALPGNDLSMVPSLAAGYHEELELAIYQDIARSSRRIADVGANVGLYTCVGAASMAAGTVIAFEPAPSNLEFLRRNIQLNGLTDRVIVIDQAVSDVPGQARLFLSDGIGNHSLAARNAGSERYLEVPVTTVDLYFGGESIDVLKVDVEGFDAHVLVGSAATLARHHPAVFVELLTEHLEQGGVAPQDLITVLTRRYDHLFVVDEVRNTVRRSTEPELLALAARNVHTNLIAVQRPEHLAVMEGYVSH
jgi:FkbM family methyltransferase